MYTARLSVSGSNTWSYRNLTCGEGGREAGGRRAGVPRSAARLRAPGWHMHVRLQGPEQGSQAGGAWEQQRVRRSAAVCACPPRAVRHAAARRGLVATEVPHLHAHILQDAHRVAVALPHLMVSPGTLPVTAARNKRRGQARKERGAVGGGVPTPCVACPPAYCRVYCLCCRRKLPCSLSATAGNEAQLQAACPEAVACCKGGGGPHLSGLNLTATYTLFFCVPFMPSYIARGAWDSAMVLLLPAAGAPAANHRLPRCPALLAVLQILPRSITGRQGPPPSRRRPGRREQLRGACSRPLQRPCTDMWGGGYCWSTSGTAGALASTPETRFSASAVQFPPRHIPCFGPSCTVQDPCPVSCTPERCSERQAGQFSSCECAAGG